MEVNLDADDPRPPARPPGSWPPPIPVGQFYGVAAIGGGAMGVVQDLLRAAAEVEALDQRLLAAVGPELIDRARDQVKAIAQTLECRRHYEVAYNRIIDQATGKRRSGGLPSAYPERW